MRMKFSDNNRSVINIKAAFIVLSVMLMGGIVFSVVQITTASPAVPDPGHTWRQIEKPTNDCSSGEYVRGANDDGWLCISESDPQVGTLTNGKWCTTNGSAVNCTSDAPGGYATCAAIETACNYVDEAGDTMSGDLTFSHTDADIKAPNSTLWLQYGTGKDTRIGGDLKVGGKIYGQPNCTTVQYPSGASQSSGWIYASCPSGKVLVGGGCKSDGGICVQVSSSYPDSANNRWACYFSDGAAVCGGRGGWAYAICCGE